MEFICVANQLLTPFFPFKFAPHQPKCPKDAKERGQHHQIRRESAFRVALSWLCYCLIDKGNGRGNDHMLGSCGRVCLLRCRFHGDCTRRDETWRQLIWPLCRISKMRDAKIQRPKEIIRCSFDDMTSSAALLCEFSAAFPIVKYSRQIRSTARETLVHFPRGEVCGASECLRGSRVPRIFDTIDAEIARGSLLLQYRPFTISFLLTGQLLSLLGSLHTYQSCLAPLL